MLRYWSLLERILFKLRTLRTQSTHIIDPGGAKKRLHVEIALSELGCGSPGGPELTALTSSSFSNKAAQG